MIVHLILSGLIVLLAAGCSAPIPTPDPLDSRPADLKVVFDWHEGSLPPPYHYDYTITLVADGQGQIVMTPDYAFNNPPTWTETFITTPEQLDQFYRLLIDKGLFTQRWQAQDLPPVGGSHYTLNITAHGQQITIPSYPIPGQAVAAATMTDALRAMVPPSRWDKLNTQREQYQQAHPN